MLDRTPDADNYPTSIGQHSMHFGKRRGFVRNELQAMLASDTVESRISKRHVCSAAHTPFNRRGCFTRIACSREHARVEIEADNLSCRTDLICCESGHNTSAARDVQHAIARFDRGDFHKSARVVPQEDVDDVCVVGKWSTTLELPTWSAGSTFLHCRLHRGSVLSASDPNGHAIYLSLM